MKTKRKNESTADELALERIEEWLPALNTEVKTPQVKRIESLISLFGRLTEDASTSDKAHALAGIRKFLSRYRWVSYVAPTTDGLLVLNEIADHMHISKEGLWEHEAVRVLLVAFPRLGIGKRPYIRRCAKCQQWFIAPRKDKITCSDACHQWLYDNKSPEQKALKAAAMKEYRKVLKDIEAKQNERRGFTKGKRRVVTKTKGR